MHWSVQLEGPRGKDAQKNIIKLENANSLFSYGVSLQKW
jgi:hypothetical protein